jgi:hypothetical protein
MGKIFERSEPQMSFEVQYLVEGRVLTAKSVIWCYGTLDLLFDTMIAQVLTYAKLLHGKRMHFGLKSRHSNSQILGTIVCLLTARIACF